MKALSRETFRPFIETILLGLFVSETMATVIIKETKVEPFSLLLDNQRQVIEKLSYVLTNIKKVESMETKVASLAYALTSATSRVEETYHNVSLLKDEVRNMSQDVTFIMNAGMAQSLSPCLENTRVKRNQCSDLVNLFKNGIEDIAKCDTIISSSVYKDINDPSVRKKPRNVVNKISVHDNERWNTKTDEKESKEYETIEEKAPQLGRNDNDNDTEYTLEGVASVEDDKLLIGVKRLIDSRANRTNQRLIRLLSLMHNIEYRQHVSILRQDTRLNTLLHKMAVHQSVFEERLTESIKRGFQSAQQHLKDKLGILEDHLIKEEQIFNGLVSMATNVSVILGDLTCWRLSRSAICSSDIYNRSRDQDDNSTGTNGPVPLPFLGNEPFNDILSSIWQSEVNVKDGFHDNLQVESNNVANYTSSTDFFPHLDHLFVNKNTTKEKQDINKLNSNLNEVKHILHYKIGEDKMEVPSANESLTSGAIEQLSKFINERIANIENTIGRRMLETEDKLMGLRIHQSSSFYSHTKEVRYEMEKMERSISETIRANGNKISKRLEGARKALLTFIDAAVTSVSSAAVTSSQSTGMLVAKELRESLKEIGNKIAESNTIKGKMMGCPDIYQKVEGKCLLVLNHTGTTWKDSCMLCKSLGGDLAYLSDKSIISILMDAFNTRMSKDLWVRHSGNSIEEISCNFKSKKEQSEELTNSLSDLTTTHDDISSHRNETDLLCSVLSIESNEIKTMPCNENLGVICQYDISGKLA